MLAVFTGGGPLDGELVDVDEPPEAMRQRTRYLQQPGRALWHVYRLVGYGYGEDAQRALYRYTGQEQG